MSYFGGARVYCVSYDLKTPLKNYQSLFEALKQSGRWWHYLQSTWLIQTNETAIELWNRIAPHIAQQDFLLIIEVRANVHGWLPKDAWDWINANVPKA